MGCSGWSIAPWFGYWDDDDKEADLFVTGDAPDPEHVSQLPAVWDTDEGGGVGKYMALRNGKDLID